MSDRFIVLSGCSGGGKSTLLEELRHRGHAVVEEPGRRIVQQELANGGTALPWFDLAAFCIVQQELANGGTALPWFDLAAFCRRAITMALEDRAAMRNHPGLVFFDRSLIDAASALEAHSGEPLLAKLAGEHRYNRTVFLTPPWPEIFAGDAERRHGFEAASTEYERLVKTYPALGYETVILPKVPVAERADFLLARR